jgi:hypothetical protein
MRRWGGFLVGALLVLTGAFSAFTQTSTTNFQVTVIAPPDGSTFVTPTNIEILASVFDASNDVAYVEFSALWRPLPVAGEPMPMIIVLIPLGTVSNSLPTGQPGSLRQSYEFIWTNPMPGLIGLQAEAVRSNGLYACSPNDVSITVETGRVLSVNIAWPTNGATFNAAANIELIATAGETGGGVASVQFFDGGKSIGIVSNGVAVDPPGSSGLPAGSLAYMLMWMYVPAGIHVLTAVATDTNGDQAVSAPVTITVGKRPPPSVRITSPANNAVFRAPVDITLLAYAAQPGGFISNVQFFAGTNSLGFGQPLLSPGPVQPLNGNSGPVGPPIFASNVFELVWNNAPPGAYALTAVATDDAGNAATSAPVYISVLPPPPPPGSNPEIVSVVAIDPIAIAGTNCWPWLGVVATPPTWSNWVSPTALWLRHTNCGPKDAIFSLRRAGATNDDLTVGYSMGGTATNGVDYVTLSGVATIPAGHLETLVPVVPLDDATHRPILTVILNLDPSTNMPPDYTIGFPKRAEALILEQEAPSAAVSAAALEDRSFLMNAQGPDGAWFRVDYTTDGLTWTALCTNQVFVGSIYFADPDAGTDTMRWYRTVPLANGPTN